MKAKASSPTRRGMYCCQGVQWDKVALCWAEQVEWRGWQAEQQGRHSAGRGHIACVLRRRSLTIYGRAAAGVVTLPGRRQLTGRSPLPGPDRDRDRTGPDRDRRRGLTHAVR